ncbi:hypothetical protein CHS0354_004824 [Potamilus streckersoni]|uniref:Uncharacterized protein n=1 Tax=Potamilus streckersoni TaxID=2493646 RepID=A0AAE0S9A3_9BIVA|nr:hypothetical protein CHS0354_004824 [Potamilus streckersoni]
MDPQNHLHHAVVPLPGIKPSLLLCLDINPAVVCNKKTVVHGRLKSVRHSIKSLRGNGPAQGYNQSQKHLVHRLLKSFDVTIAKFQSREGSQVVNITQDTTTMEQTAEQRNRMTPNWVHANTVIPNLTLRTIRTLGKQQATT